MWVFTREAILYFSTKIDFNYIFINIIIVL
jgi:hypothetical protein